MGVRPDSVEGKVLCYVKNVNRPLNAQIVTDNLQTQGVKKTAAQKALDSLAESKEIVVKEYGKQKIYLARQDHFESPDSEELERRQKDNEALQEKVKAQELEVNELEARLKAMKGSLTLDAITARIQQLGEENRGLEEKLTTLRSGQILVNEADRQKVEHRYTYLMSMWRKRKRIFKDLWAMITENLDRNLKEFREELGIQFDEDCGVDVASYENLGPRKRRR